ncbi:MAG: hypothetical protein AABY15_05190 [Nanoarchaeota archaeon]
MDKKDIEFLLKLSEKTEVFLMDYASGYYGKCEDRIKITKKVVKDFMKKSNKEDMEEALSYLEFADEMKEEIEINGGGASDLEDWIYHVINREKE